MRGFFVLQLLFLSSIAVVGSADNKDGLIGVPISSKEETQKRRELSRLRSNGVTTKVNEPRRLGNRQRADGRRPKRHHGKPAPRKHYYYDDDLYADGDDLYVDDNYYDDKSPKSKGSKGKHNHGKDFYPSWDNAFLDDNFFDDHFFEDDDCELVTFNETFAIGGPTLFLAPDTTPTNAGDPALPGTVFIFERESILELDGTSTINGTVVSGTCTRTTIGTNGGGVCHLVFVDEDGFSINVNGDLQSPLGGPLAITGGTGGMVGVVGEVDLFPIFETDTQFGDVFLDAVRYEVLIDLGLIVCP